MTFYGDIFAGVKHSVKHQIRAQNKGFEATEARSMGTTSHRSVHSTTVVSEGHPRGNGDGPLTTVRFYATKGG